MATTISVLPKRTGQLDRRVFGGFVEHLGRCIYGGLYEEGSSLSDEHGFRKDVLELLKDLRLSVLRWPGGNFVSNYHWQDGVGPKDRRPVRAELAWSGTELNRFGTDEYIDYCAALGAEPYICLNMGTGTLEEALAWVEYCNGRRATAWAEYRRSNGHPEPFEVSWWGLGNEIYGEWQVGALSAKEYVAEATRWARAIRLVDPHAKLVSCGELGWTDWDRTVIDGLVDLVDLHSLHLYSGTEDYWFNALAPHNAERAIATTSALLKRAAYVRSASKVPRIVYDEWNVWYRSMEGALEERFTFADALAVGTYLNIFVRNCEWVTMANMAQMVNAIAPVVTTPSGAEVQPIYYPFLLHSQGHLSHALAHLVSGPEVEAPRAVGRWPYPVDDLAPFSLIDAAVTTNEAGDELAVTIVNRSEEPEEITIRMVDGCFEGAGSLQVLTEDHRRHMPLVGVHLEQDKVSTTGSLMTYELPARSFAAVAAAVR